MEESQKKDREEIEKLNVVEVHVDTATEIKGKGKRSNPQVRDVVISMAHSGSDYLEIRNFVRERLQRDSLSESDKTVIRDMIQEKIQSGWPHRCSSLDTSSMQTISAKIMACSKDQTFHTSESM